MKNPDKKCYQLWLDTKDVDMEEALKCFEVFALQIRNEALEDAAKIGESYAEAAKGWGLKCDSSGKIRALKTGAPGKE